ncbi:DUF2184 domain-containing protein [Paraburkholderia adhaesiva]|uniref:DUF2184 domain-containing protein n=1 Tax=Paraburkholderia adhaesiva TaxID=2883244 RepID=UPI001F38AF26|nr:DUF2184 domain-containing protein [Paraburkholderia adhaesiva]
MRHSDFDQLERTFGIVMPEVLDYTTALLAMDAQGPLVTAPNAGIPAWLANFIDPEFIEILVTPNKAAAILGEAKKGNWTTLTATFPVIESTGEVSSYGDYNENGSVSANADFPQRQSYHYQTMTQWGERQLEMSSLAKIDYVSRVNIASAIVLDKFQNNTYFFGVAGLQNYGLLNDPRLSASLTPGAKAFNGNTSGPWITNGAVTASANEIYTDIQTLFNELVLQSGGLIEMDARMTLAMAPSSSVALTTTNMYNVNVTDLLKKNFPNLKIETAVQYQNPAGGNLLQLIAEAIDGQKTGYCAFTEKLRAHGIVRDSSSFKQKKSQGSWGTVLFQPFAIASMLGV